MAKGPFEIKAPVAWLPAGLISWYAPDGAPIALVTSWIALIGGERPRIRTAWHGRHDALSRFWAAGDFILNVPYGSGLDKIREAMLRGKLCLNAERDLGSACSPGVAVVAPRLLDCAVQIECVGGRLVETGFDAELCGGVVRLHRGQVVVDPQDVPDLCAIHPLSPLGTA